eukprot:9472239-Pyramimonas_sp.AAC.1
MPRPWHVRSHLDDSPGSYVVSMASNHNTTAAKPPSKLFEHMPAPPPRSPPCPARLPPRDP